MHMQRNTKFRFGCDRTPDWIKQIERDELTRPEQRERARQQLADIIGDVARTGAECLAALEAR